MAEQINPWSSTPKMDINRLIADFGIEPFASVKEKIADPPVFIRRDIVAGHRGYNAVADSMYLLVSCRVVIPTLVTSWS